MNTRGYDPQQHADALGITVSEYPLRTDNGLWIPDQKLILIRPRLKRVLHRSVLAHEVAHALLAHRDTSAKNEVGANRLAAEHCIDRDHLIDLMQWRPDHPAAWSDELQVSHELLRVYLNVHRLAG